MYSPKTLKVPTKEPAITISRLEVPLKEPSFTLKVPAKDPGITVKEPSIPEKEPTIIPDTVVKEPIKQLELGVSNKDPAEIVKEIVLKLSDKEKPFTYNPKSFRKSLKGYDFTKIEEAPVYFQFLFETDKYILETSKKMDPSFL